MSAHARCGVGTCPRILAPHRPGFARMRRLILIALLSVPLAAALVGCGQKGPLVLPPVKPDVQHPAPNAAPATTAAAPASQEQHG